MKKFTLACFMICLGTFGIQAQEIAGIDASPLDISVFRTGGRNGQTVARAIYSRPAKKGRTIFGGLVPYGKIWRTGANESTELNIFKDLSIGGKILKAGNYTMYTIPGEKEWTIIINSKLNTWGTYNYDESKDVMRFEVPVSSISKVNENFGIAFDGKDGKGKLLLAWDKTEIYIDFEYQIF